MIAGEVVFALCVSDCSALRIAEWKTETIGAASAVGIIEK
jgi:hypothetical protein